MSSIGLNMHEHLLRFDIMNFFYDTYTMHGMISWKAMKGYRFWNGFDALTRAFTMIIEGWFE